MGIVCETSDDPSVVELFFSADFRNDPAMSPLYNMGLALRSARRDHPLVSRWYAINAWLEEYAIEAAVIVYDTGDNMLPLHWSVEFRHPRDAVQCKLTFGEMD